MICSDTTAVTWDVIADNCKLLTFQLSFIIARTEDTGLEKGVDTDDPHLNYKKEEGEKTKKQ